MAAPAKKIQKSVAARIPADEQLTAIVPVQTMSPAAVVMVVVGMIVVIEILAIIFLGAIVIGGLLVALIIAMPLLAFNKQYVIAVTNRTTRIYRAGTWFPSNLKNEIAEAPFVLAQTKDGAAYLLPIPGHNPLKVHARGRFATEIEKIERAQAAEAVRQAA